jgi:hypothetical protein
MAHMPAYGAGGSSCSDSDSCSGPRIVSYTATGAEAGTATIPIGATLSAADYSVGFFCCITDGADVPWAWAFPNASRTTSQFGATFTGTLTSGATYKFQIVEA